MPINPKHILITLLLFLVFIVGAFIRFDRLGEHPAGFFADEAGLSYNAYLLGKDGRDQSGNFLPFYINIFSPRGPIPVYDQILAIKIFGLNEFGARFTSAFLGSLTIITMFCLGYILFKNYYAGLFAALLTATEPWHIHFSRFGTENIQLPFFFSIFIILFIEGIKKDKKIYLLASLLFMFFSFYSYTASNFFIPPFLIGVLIIYYKILSKNKYFLILLIISSSLIFVPLSLQLAKDINHSRFSEVSVFKNETLVNAALKMKNTYVESYSPNFLFLKGDIEMPHHFINRFSVKGSGELFLITAPFFIIGLFTIFYKIRKKEYQLLLLWLILYPIGSVMAGADGGGPFATRSIIGVLIFPLITTLGFINFVDFMKTNKRKIAVSFVIVGLIITSLSSYLKLYYVDYPKYSLDFWGWQFGARDIVSYFVENQNKYDKFVMAPEFNAPEIFLKFYGKDKCNKCQIGLPEDDQTFSPKTLYAIPPNYLTINPQYKIQTTKIIYYPNRQPAFYIGTIKHIDNTVD